MKAWEDFLDSQEKELGSTTVKKWLRTLKVVCFDAGNLYLEAKDSFQIHWFEEHIRPTVIKQLVGPSHKKIKVHLSLAAVATKKAAVVTPSAQNSALKDSPPPTFQLHFDSIDPKITLSSFIATEANKVTYNLMHELIQGSISLGSFNPIYIYGPPGSGKSHLLLALYNALKAQGYKILYTKAETFTDHVVSAIRLSEMHKFRAAYRNQEILLVDDVEIFSKKGATQEELFHTFNTLHLEGKQIVLSANCPPHELQDIEARLVSRFEWGIVLPLYPLDPENLTLLLKQRSHELDLSIQDDAIAFLITTFHTNSQNLLKALDALALRLHTKRVSGYKIKLPLSLFDTKDLLFDLIKAEEAGLLTLDKIVKTVAEYHGITVEDIRGRSQNREYSFPRKIAIYLARVELKLPFLKIGQFFSRDHSTIMTSVKQIEEEKAKNPNFAATLSLIQRQLSSPK